MTLEQYLLNSERGVPEGSYLELSGDYQGYAIELGIVLGLKLGCDKSVMQQILADYRNLEEFQTLYEMGLKYGVDEGGKHSYEVVRHAVGYAVAEIMPSEELGDLRAKRKVRSLELQVGGFDSDECRERATLACVKRNEIHGAPIEALIRGRGQTPWTDAEKECLFGLLDNAEYRLEGGKHPNAPDYELLALELNMQFHDSEEVREAKKVGNYVRDARRKGWIE